MPTLESSATQSATLDTEHTLATITTNKFFELYVDVSNMALGDKLLIRAKYICLTAGAEQLFSMIPVDHVPTEKFVRSGPIASDISVKFTLEQTDGTGRNFPWKVLSWT